MCPLSFRFWSIFMFVLSSKNQMPSKLLDTKVIIRVRGMIVLWVVYKYHKIWLSYNFPF